MRRAPLSCPVPAAAGVRRTYNRLVTCFAPRAALLLCGMDRALLASPRTPAAGLSLSRTLAAAVLLGGAALWWASTAWPADLPVFLPWEFSWIEYLGLVFPFVWYCHGLALTPRARRPGWPRRIAFFLGTALIYGVMETRYVYFSQHMFLLNRIQHASMHHIGPFLIALAWPGETIARACPDRVLRLCRSQPVQRGLAVLMNPVIAAVLFAGLVILWLQPPVQFRMMISPPLYLVMNLSMVLDGLLFWFLVLDPRPSPPARHSYTVRLVTAIAVVFPQLIMGAMLTFSTQPWYPYYDLCGRLFPEVSALLDQHLGGLVVWIPSSMMSSIAFLLIINNVRLNDDLMSGGKNHDDIEIAPGVRLSSASWTGR
jgi:putative membrane protein